jgi:hypothetical protein
MMQRPTVEERKYAASSFSGSVSASGSAKMIGPPAPNALELFNMAGKPQSAGPAAFQPVPQKK